MDAHRRAAAILETAERALVKLAAESAAARDYAGAGLLLAIAQRVAAAGTPGPPAVAVPPPAARAGLAAARKKPGGGGVYPQFRREDDALVKVGWSKSDRDVYEHRSPRAVLDRLVARVVEAGGGGRRFTTGELFPLLDPDGRELPTYQGYLCLAWLVLGGLVRRHGRQGYTVPAIGTLRADVEAAWRALPGG